MHNPHKDYSNVSPQREDGHREIESTVFQALIRASLSGAEFQLVLFVIDKTWGWDKREDVIPLSQFEEATHLEKRNIVHYLKRLEERRIILIQRSGPGRGRGNTYMFNKYWDTWITEKVLPIHHLISNSVEDTPFSEPEKPAEELVSPVHQLASISVPDTPLGNSVPPTPIKAGKGVNSAGKGVSHAQGKGVPATPSIEISKETSIERSTTYKEKEEGKPPDTLAATTPASEYLFGKSHRKRWANEVQKEQFEKVEDQVGFPKMKEAIDWALTSGISNIKSILTAAKRGSKEKEKSSAEKKEKGESYGAGRQPPGGGTGAHRDDPLKTTRERGWETGDDEGGEDGA